LEELYGLLILRGYSFPNWCFGS